MDCSLLGSSVHGIFQARTLEWVAISFSRGSSWPRDWPQVSCIAGRVTMWVTREGRNKREPGINSLTNCMALHEFPTQTGYVGILSCDLHSPMMCSCWFFRVFTESVQWTLWCTTDSSFCPQQGGPCAITARSVGSWRYTAKFLFRNCSQFKVTSPFWETCIHWLVHVGLQGPVSYLNLGGPPPAHEVSRGSFWGLTAQLLPILFLSWECCMQICSSRSTSWDWGLQLTAPNQCWWGFFLLIIPFLCLTPPHSLHFT